MKFGSSHLGVTLVMQVNMFIIPRSFALCWFSIRCMTMMMMQDDGPHNKNKNSAIITNMPPL